MAQGEGFRHITVTAAEDDDAVIHAGIVRGDDGAAPATQGDDCVETADDQRDGADSCQEADVTPRPAVQEDPVAPNGLDADERAAWPARTGEGGRSSQPARSRAKRDDYRETTLEDLQSLKMPLVQRIVIIAAVLCIIGAIAYCAVFMG